MKDAETFSPLDGPWPGAGGEVLLVALLTAFVFLSELTLRAMGVLALPPELRTLPALLAGALAAAWLAWRRGDAIRALGLARRTSWLRTLGWALAILIAFILAQNMAALVAAQWSIPAPDYSRYDYLRGNWLAAIAAWLLLIATAAIPEELLYRGFLLGRLEELVGAGRAGVFIALIGQALVFGLTHFQWGIGGILMTTLMGLVWGAGYLLAGRNLRAVILAHSLAHLLLVLQLASRPPA